MTDLRRRMIRINDDEEWKWRIRTPRVGLAAVVESRNRKSVILISRKFPPHGLAFPGGFIELGEDAVQAGCREVFEETHLRTEPVGLLNVTSDPGLDPRMHLLVVAAVFRLENGASEFPHAGDDAEDAIWCRVETLRRGDCGELTPRSRVIAGDYLRWRDIGRPVLPLC